MRDLPGPGTAAFPVFGRRWILRGRSMAAGRRLARGRSLPRPTSESRPGGERTGRWLPVSVSWTASFLLHAAVLVLGVSLLFHPVRFDVSSGKTSTELVLVAAPWPATAVVASQPPRLPAPAVTPPQAQPVLPPAPVPVPVVRRVAVVPPPQPAAVAAPAAEHRLAKVKTKAEPAHEASLADRGAVLARPDDLNNQPPVYPEDSRAAREEGVVMLRVEVSPLGSARRVAVLRSSGYFRLDQAARKAVEVWRFHPASIGSEAIPSEVDVPVRFVLQ